MEKVEFVTITVLGPRGLPHGTVRLPEHVVAEIPMLLDAALRLNPTTNLDEVVRAIFRYGIRNLRNVLQGGDPIDLAKLPGPQAPIR